MKLFAPGTAVKIRYPTGQANALTLAQELAARLDELVVADEPPFAGLVREGIATSADVSAIYVGLAQDWAADLGGLPVPWWNDTYDFGIRVVADTACIKAGCTRRELHVIARDEPLLLRAAWLLLQELGWRHYMPNGVAGLEDLWVVKNPRDTLRTRIDRIWSGAVDHLIPTIAGGTTNLNWSDGTTFAESDVDSGLDEGDLAGAFGTRPLIVADAEPSWLRHMGWTTSTTLQVNTAWVDVAKFSTKLEPWNEDTGTGHYTATSFKLYTDHVDVRVTALDYANSKVNQKESLDWVSLARSDDDAPVEWEVDFNDSVFGAKLPVTRQIQLANFVATNPSYLGKGIVIQAYGDCAETPDADMPDAAKVCTIVVEAYRPPGKTVEQIIDDYVDDDGKALCPLGLYQYLYSAAWGPGIITAGAGSPEFVVAAVNRVRRLPAVSPKVVCGEAMTEFGLYGLGYYCYMQMVLDVGRVDADFTIEDFHAHAARFFNDLYPTPEVHDGVRAWYDALLDLDHKPLLSSDLLNQLWSALQAAILAAGITENEQRRVAELCKFTRYLDLRNILEAAQAVLADTLATATDPDLDTDTEVAAVEVAYKQMMEWLFRIRDSGLVDVDSLFDQPLYLAADPSLQLGNIFATRAAPPSGWTREVPSLDECVDLIAVGLDQNLRHGLTDTVYGPELEGGWNTLEGTRLPVDGNLLKLEPYPKGKMKLWLIPATDTFVCNYAIVSGARAEVEFVNQKTLVIDAALTLTETATPTTPTIHTTTLKRGQLYEIRLTTYATGDMITLDWWTPIDGGILHYLSFDPGREGDPCGFGPPNTRSFYFLVPAGINEIHFYAEYTTEMALYSVNDDGSESPDTAFDPIPRTYQSHTLAPNISDSDRVMRIDGIKLNQIGFWLLNCPNLFALHPQELLRPRPPEPALAIQ